MGTVSYARNQVSEIVSNRSSLTRVIDQLNSFKTTLNSGWQAKEIDYVNIAIDNINKEINRITNELESIENAIMTAAYEIEREEREARERAEREARERAEREKAANK
ncbi:hypothetical protein [Sutcliffiella sp. NC1]|uniref:hypothetical protein n=1 Tax=Sutcliffiella sp. NC1 TaxID=3004096 RepID=UPI0022DD7598|nr:hypothetical protein [Sutcliffiella sp. NC1]WBL14619.1 hypothetical protein O1A01_22535 [Sutcliffiella sp. NC1]